MLPFLSLIAKFLSLWYYSSITLLVQTQTPTLSLSVSLFLSLLYLGLSLRVFIPFNMSLSKCLPTLLSHINYVIWIVGNVHRLKLIPLHWQRQVTQPKWKIFTEKPICIMAMIARCYSISFFSHRSSIYLFIYLVCSKLCGFILI